MLRGGQNQTTKRQPVERVVASTAACNYRRFVRLCCRFPSQTMRGYCS